MQLHSKEGKEDWCGGDEGIENKGVKNMKGQSKERVGERKGEVTSVLSKVDLTRLRWWNIQEECRVLELQIQGEDLG